MLLIRFCVFCLTAAEWGSFMGVGTLPTSLLLQWSPEYCQACPRHSIKPCWIHSSDSIAINTRKPWLWAEYITSAQPMAEAVFGVFLNNTNILHWIIIFIGKIVWRDSFDNQELTALLNVLMKCPLIEIVSSKHTGVSS